jgi:hypothetical protein
MPRTCSDTASQPATSTRKDVIGSAGHQATAAGPPRAANELVQRHGTGSDQPDM